jgi:hypothetical protein
MRVNKVHQEGCRVSYKANVIDSASLRKFKAGLNAADSQSLDKYIKQIEQSKSKNNYIFDYISVGSFKNIRKFVGISIQNKDKTIQHPPVFSAAIDNALDVFKNLAESLK